MDNQITETEESKKTSATETEDKKGSVEKKKVSLADFKVKSFVTNVKVDQMHFLKTAGG